MGVEFGPKGSMLPAKGRKATLNMCLSAPPPFTVAGRFSGSFFSVSDVLCVSRFLTKDPKPPPQLRVKRLDPDREQTPAVKGQTQNPIGFEGFGFGVEVSGLRGLGCA